MRGKVECRLLPFPANRITPAYAGKRRAKKPDLTYEEDHPRVCGEKESVNDGTAIRAGSPPRMRGKASGVLSFGACIGITPAYAGKRHGHPANRP